MEAEIGFESEKHREYFEELVRQGEGELDARQSAFLYLIARYQEAYIQYEGMPFFVEVYEEVSIDGPVYLLEDCVDLSTYDHERILVYGKAILQGRKLSEEEVPVHLRGLINQAEKIVQNQIIKRG